MYGVIPFLSPPPPQMCKQFKTVLQSPYCYCLLTVSSHEKCDLLKLKQGNNTPNLKPKQVYKLIMACQLLHILFQEDQLINLLRLQVGALGGHNVSCCREDSFRGDTCGGNGQVHYFVPIFPVAESETCSSSTKSEDCLSSWDLVLLGTVPLLQWPADTRSWRAPRVWHIRLSEECPAGILVFLWLSHPGATDPLSQISRGFPLPQGSQPVAEVV